MGLSFDFPRHRGGCLADKNLSCMRASLLLIRLWAIHIKPPLHLRILRIKRYALAKDVIKGIYKNICWYWYIFDLILIYLLFQQIRIQNKYIICWLKALGSKLRLFFSICYINTRKAKKKAIKSIYSRFEI